MQRLKDLLARQRIGADVRQSRVDVPASEMVPALSFRPSDSSRADESNLEDVAEEASHEVDLLGDVLDDLARDVAEQWSSTR